ncbi:AraC family transcriptional regulator [Microvirga lenta]|uniref:AraC family transcriptional regulator n=1 Tax=Microvirga lenta TaxID=2881337 RepID=UPI001CFFE114|nr:AraC family transcriptional regulator [Microvirga lenta]MCB5176946.1 AraC family transcriptional regulator [Microvirga lenta]
MATGAYGQRLGTSVGAEAPPTTTVQILQRATFAATRIQWDDRADGVAAEIPREDAHLLCLQRRDIPTNPYWVDGRPVPMSPVRGGQFTLLDLNLGHASFLRAPIDCVAMYLPRQALDGIVEEHGLLRFGSISTPLGVPVDDARVRDLGECLLPALERPEQTNSLFVEYLALALLSHLVGTYGDAPVRIQLKRGGLAAWQERRAKEILTAHLDGNVALDRLASECGLSRSHFARAFRMTTGMPPHKWLLQRRIEVAKTLLRTTTLPLEEVASQCGFADQSHFTRVFSRMTQASPSEWRRSFSGLVVRPER